MKIALAQMRVIPGDPERNFRTMERLIAQAREAQCHLVAFPEMCIGGYLLGDLWTDDGWCSYLCGFNEKLRDLSRDITIIYGNVFVDSTQRNKDGRSRKYNAGYVFSNGEPSPRKGLLPAGITIKSLLPNYRIFDDERYFFSLQDLAGDVDVPVDELLQPFELVIDGSPVRIGVEICEDLWFNDYFHKGRPLNISRYLIRNGAQRIFNLSSSPWTYGKNRARNNRIKDSRRDCGDFVPFYYVNCVGVQNNGKNVVVFDGDTTVYTAEAEVAQAAQSPFVEELIVHSTEHRYAPLVKRPVPMIRAKYHAIIQGIRGMDDIVGNSDFPYVLGLSGGIDSAVVACLLAQAVGPQRIIACNLPGRFNSDATISIAGEVAASLGLKLHTIPIDDFASANVSLLADFAPTGLNWENIQAKIRGTSILSNIAGIRNGVMTCNGNKVEIALGYATLYGDVNGALAPIGDLLKTEVFEMAKLLNREIFGAEVVPASLIPNDLFDFGVPPSAELRADQVDPMKWGYHDALIQAMTDYRKAGPEVFCERYLEKTLRASLGISESLWARYDLDNPTTFITDLEWVVDGMRRAVFKRVQSPPIIILSKGSFGYDIRESQLPLCWTERYRELRRRILEVAPDASSLPDRY